MENHVFSGRAQDYVNFRTDYPEFLRTYIKKNLDLKKDDILADIGAGTGLLAKCFLEMGNTVYGIEPNADMRKEGEQILAEFQNYRSVQGSAEKTGLEDSSVNLIVAGNAFHWFDPLEAKKEFKRILKSGGRVFLVRTDWKEYPDERMQEYDRIIMKYCTGRGGIVTDPELERKVMNDFFSDYKRLVLGESLFPYTKEQVKGRFLSTSFSPKVGDASYQKAMEELDQLFDKFQKGGKFSFGSLATVVIGRL